MLWIWEEIRWKTEEIGDEREKGENDVNAGPLLENLEECNRKKNEIMKRLLGYSISVTHRIKA